MKLKSLLFGSAAALTVVSAAQTGAQAADLDVLPVAEPVEYVRICDAAGAGYFFIPGSETCLRIGGYVRVEAHVVQPYDYSERIGFFPEPSETLQFNHFTTRARGDVQFNTYTATDIGVIETYIELLGNYGPSDFGGYTSAPTVVDKAWIRLTGDFATIQVGRADSYFDFFAGYWAGFRGLNDDPTGGTNLFAITANFGNGFSASISAEDPLSSGRASQLVASDDFFLVASDAEGDEDVQTFETFPVGGAFGLTGGQDWPDVVGRLRLDQAWGAAQVMGVIHQVESGLERRGATAPTGELIRVNGRPVFDRFGELRRVTGGSRVFGQSQEEEIGWAVGAGLQVKIPGTAFQASIQGTYAEGAIGYVTTGNGGPRTDGIVRQRVVRGLDRAGNPVRAFVPTDEIELSEAWSVRAGIQAGLTESLRASITGSYAEVDLDGDEGGGDRQDLRNNAVFTPIIPFGDYRTWAIAGRVDYTVVTNLVVTAEVGYENIELEDEERRRLENQFRGQRLGEDEFELDRWGGGIRIQRSF